MEKAVFELYQQLLQATCRAVCNVHSIKLPAGVSIFMPTKNVSVTLAPSLQLHRHRSNSADRLSLLVLLGHLHFSSKMSNPIHGQGADLELDDPFFLIQRYVALLRVLEKKNSKMSNQD